MHGYVTDIERDALDNQHYRRVLFTGPNTQLVLMTLQPGDEIGQETHEEHDQFIRIEAGAGVVVLNGERHTLKEGSAVVIPAGVKHNVVNESDDAPLRLCQLESRRVYTVTLVLIALGIVLTFPPVWQIFG